jgi:DCN1-like protein 4/5
MCPFADIEIAQALITLLLVDRHPLATSFLDFLKQQDSYKGLNVDQWTSLLEFCKTIDTNFANYDENGACTPCPPSISRPAACLLS